MFEIFNKNNKIQKSGKRGVDENGKYVENLEHIRGNAAIGEQVHSVRTYRTDKPMTFEEMKLHWDEMNREAKEWLENNPGQSANFITSRDTGGNEITRAVPAKDLIFSGSNLVAVYDEKTGNQIVGKENIIREIQRRRKQSDEWIREGKLENTFDKIHHTDDGWTSNVRFTAYPNKLHPNEVKAETDQLIKLATDKRKNQLGIEISQGLSERISEVSADDASNKKPRTEERGSTIYMDIDQPETSTSKGQNIELKKMSKDELINLREKITNELESREKNKATSSDFRDFSTRNLKEQSRKIESALNNFSTSPNSSPQSNSVLPIGIIGGVSLLVGGLVFWKIKKKQK